MSVHSFFPKKFLNVCYEIRHYAEHREMPSCFDMVPALRELTSREGKRLIQPSEVVMLWGRS